MRGLNPTEISEDATLGIAPWWHTCLLLAPILIFSLLGSLKPAHHALSQLHVAQYSATLAWEWILAALVVWGIRLRKTALRQLLGVKRPALRDWRDDLLLAAAFWIGSMIVLAAIGVLLKLAHFSTPQKQLAQLAPQSEWNCCCGWFSAFPRGFAKSLHFAAICCSSSHA